MEFLAERSPWFVAGPLLGLLVAGLLWAVNRPLGALGGYVDLLAWLRGPSGGVRSPVFFLVGTVIGGLLSAFASGGFHPTSGYGTFDARFGTDVVGRSVLLAASGIVMGFGARAASGCTSGHGVCGTALGSPRSWVATATFMAVAVAVTNGIALLLRGRP